MDELWKAIIPWFLRVFGTAIGIGIAFMFIKSATLPSQLTGTVKRGWSKARKNYKESAPGQYRARIKANAQRAVETGNFSGTAKNPLNWTKLGGSRINRGLNRSRFYNAATRGYGAARSLDIRNQNLEAQKKSQDEFGGDYELEEAWIQDGGVAGEHYTGGAYDKSGTNVGIGKSKSGYNERGKYVGMGLNEGQKRVYDQMVRDGRGKNANSFIAAMRGVAQSGRGNQDMVQQVYKQIEDLNPTTSASDKHALAEEMRGTWRGVGRGDLAGDSSGGPKRQNTFDAGIGGGAWKEVDAHSISRHAFDEKVNPNGANSFVDFIASDSEGLRNVVRALDDPWKDERAKAKVVAAIETELNPTTTSGRLDPALSGLTIDQLRERYADKVKTV